MTDSERITALEAHLFAQTWLLTALLDTHPRRDLLSEEFEVLAERHISMALGSGASDANISALEAARERWRAWLKPPGHQG
ncbi:hypothetical protein AB870_02770 [Pandoraea faecigallinarum]|uniref:Uncharacterized protein n=1 Tax=Pandoraea faecigallinarum TaxID=656179 RepID=A0A0H3WRW0_9BURK|nr:hypothetical protein [Pandoraea faecigallinarum]AKM29281.1 hypothetical protein AB870_02770 [Pandoraea faecigallinarum]